MLFFAALASSLAGLPPPPAVAASDPFAECEASFAADPEGWITCGCFYNAAVQQGWVDEAARRLAIHLAAAPENPCLSFSLGRLRYLARDPSAGDLLRVAADGYRARGEIRGEVYARINRSRFLNESGDSGAAFEAFEAARRAAAPSADPMLAAQLSLQHARLLLSGQQDLERIERMLLEVEGIAFPDGSAGLRRDTAQLLGDVQYALGRFAEAERQYRRILEITRASDDLYGAATALQNSVIARMALGPGPGRREESLALLREALEAAVKAGQREAEADARLRLGKLLGGEEGRRELRASVRLAREIGARGILARALAALAVLHLPDHPAEARRLASESLDAGLESPSFASDVFGWSDRMEVVWATRPRAEAAAEGFATLDRIDRFRDLQRAEEGRARVFSAWAEVYYGLAGRFLDPAEGGEPQDVERAFSIQERLRGRVLLEALAAARMAPAPGLPAPSFATLDEVRAALAPEEAMLTFQLAPWRDLYGGFAGGAWLLATTRRETRAYRLPGRDELEPVLRVFRHLFPRRDGSETELAEKLYDRLLRPVLDDLPPAIRRLVLVPDGALHRLPFGALHGAGGVPLAARYRLSFVPSATLWLRWRSAGPRAAGIGRGALVLADPWPGGIDPSDGSEKGSGAIAERAWPSTRGTRLAALPNARREGKAAARSLGRSSVLLVGDAASEKALEEAGGPWSVLHFAAHAVIDGERPRRSAVVLSPGGPDRDGLLQPHEIADLDLDGSVVVLSTCRSAGGTVLAGEGPLSLARAFFGAGARTVVASLWPLRDDDAAELFGRFYRHLGRGASVAGALAAAQIERIEAGAPDAAWAGVGVYGDGTVVPVPEAGGARWKGLVWLAAVAAGLGIALLASRRRQ